MFVCRSFSVMTQGQRMNRFRITSLLLALSFAACGGTVGPESASQPPSTTADVHGNGRRALVGPCYLVRQTDGSAAVTCPDLEATRLASAVEPTCPAPPPAPVCPAPERSTAPVFRECDHLQPCAETIRHGQPVGEGCPMPLDDNYARCGIAIERVESPVECANLGSCILSVRGGLKPGLGCPHEGSALYEECSTWQPPRPRAARRTRARRPR